jgi:hypothetical protein
MVPMHLDEGTESGWLGTTPPSTADTINGGYECSAEPRIARCSREAWGLGLDFVQLVGRVIVRKYLFRHC